MGDCPIHWNYAHIIFLAPFAGQGVLNKDPTIWLGGTKPPPISLITSSANSKFDKFSSCYQIQFWLKGHLYWHKNVTK